MDRILMSQNNENHGTDYVVVNGVLLQDKEDIYQYGQKIIQDTNDFQTKYSDDYLTVKQKGNKILFSSHYENTDEAGRKIYYVYLLSKQDNLERILDYLEKDSLALNRQLDREKTMEIIKKINENDTLKNNLAKWVVIGIGAAVVLGTIAYLISKNYK